MDTGLQFRTAGLKSIVYLSPAPVDEESLVVLDTESREIPPDAAYVKVRQAAQRIQSRRIYKKIDSTLRGNVGRELDAVMDELDLARALVTPAFPGGGRTVQEGYLAVNGSPLRQTDFIEDPLCPSTDHIPTLLEAQSQRSVGHVGMEATERGPDALRREVERRTAQILVVDASTEEHLRTVARAAALLNQECLLCGAAGLAQALPVGFEMAAGSPRAEGKRNPCGGRVVLLAGSTREVTRRQIEGASRDPSTTLIELDLSEMNVATTEALQSAHISLSESRDVLVTTAFSSFVPGLGEAIAEALGSIAADLVRSHTVSGLVVTGGATAFAVCQRLEILSLEIEDEIAAGVPAGRVIGGPWDGLRLVTKAGGFGEPDTLRKAIEHIRGGT
jgi:uncharacterized protein YgbK (DUF1537 family)